MKEIKREKLDTCLTELLELAEANHSEVSDLPFEYNPNVKLYTALEIAGRLVVMTLRVDGELKGYTISILDVNLMYQVPCGINLILYVTPDARGRASLKLISKTEEVLKILGAEMYTWIVPKDNDFSSVLIRNGCSLLETSYVKLL